MGKIYFLQLFIFISLFLGIESLAFGQNVSYLEFDGNDSYYVNDASNKLDVNGSDWTIEMWVYPTTVPVSGTYPAIMSRKYSFEVYFRNTNGNLGVGILAFEGSGDGFTSEGSLHSSTQYMTLNEWHHIAISSDYNGSSRTTGLYLDGTRLYYSNDADFSLDASVSAINIGARYDGGYERYIDDCGIDEIRYSKSARYTGTSFTINKYDNQYTADASTILLYHLNENSGTSLDNNDDDDFDATLRSSTNDATWRAWNYHASNILPLSKNTWDGSSSTDWTVGANWSMDAVPTSESYVVIADVTNQPTIGNGNTGNCGNITIDASATFAIDGTLNIAGDFTNSGSFTANGTVEFNGDDVQNIAAGTYTNLSLNNTSAANCTFDGITVVNGTLDMDCDVTNNNILDCNGTVNSKADCIINNNGTIKIAGTYTQLGDYNNTAGLVIFDGNATQTIPEDGFYNVQINNSSDVTLDGNVSIAGTLTLTDGIINTSSTKLLTINDGGSVSGGSNTAHIDGPIAKVGAGDFVFPVGDGGKWARVGLSSLSSSETFTVEYNKATPTSNTTYTDPLTKVSDNEWWQIDRAGTATADVTMYWEDSKWSGIGNFDDLRTVHWNSTSSKWEEVTGTYTHTGNVDLDNAENGTLKVTGVSSFSPFSLGTIDNTTNTLPIELISFNLSKTENTVQLNWATASEINNSGFEIQRSNDAKEWETLNFVNGAGNSNNVIRYSYIDKNPLMANYYRLKQIDYDGSFEYSPIKYIDFNRKGNISIYPNPTKQGITINGIDSDRVANIYIFDHMGKLIKTYGPNTQQLDVQAYANGIYYIRIQYVNGEEESVSFIKK